MQSMMRMLTFRQDARSDEDSTAAGSVTRGGSFGILGQRRRAQDSRVHRLTPRWIRSRIRETHGLAAWDQGALIKTIKAAFLKADLDMSGDLTRLELADVLADLLGAEIEHLADDASTVMSSKPTTPSASFFFSPARPSGVPIVTNEVRKYCTVICLCGLSWLPGRALGLFSRVPVFARRR
jgi:hypothetical protein